MDQGAGTTADQRRIEHAHLLGRRYYILAVLLLVGMLNFVDRNIMSVLIEPIRKELQLSDSEMGLLTGVAFALTYVTMAIPAARLADRWSRRNVITIAILVWSVSTMFCGLAKNSFHIFLARFGVGFGEAGGSPPSQALVSDLFPRHWRSTALATLALCAPIGTAIGLSFGDWSLSQFDWRTTFILAGLPGLLIAPLVFFTVPDVPKGLSDGISDVPPTPPFLETVRILWSIRTFRYLLFATALQTIVSTGLITWIPAFLSRSHGMEPGTLGASLGFSLAAGTIIGSLTGGPLVDWIGRRDLRRQLWTGVFSSLASGVLAAAAFLAAADHVFLLLGVMSFFGGLFAGPLFGISLTLAPVAARATASACMLVVINMAAFGLAPQFVGVASDLLRPAFGEESLRAALLGATLIAAPTALFFFLASLTYRADLSAAAARDHALGADTFSRTGRG